MNNIVKVNQKLNDLPYNIICIIKEYIPYEILVFLNKTNYISYHKYIKHLIINYESYIRDIIRRDNIFVFEKIFNENIDLWINKKNYYYKNMIFNNYLYFLKYYALENDSMNIRILIMDYLKLHNLCKNMNKKNIIKYINNGKNRNK